MGKKKIGIADYCNNDKVMFVCISASFQGKPGFEDRKGKPYECTQKYWELKCGSLIKAKEADYICGTSKCIIKGVYKNKSGWKQVKDFTGKDSMKNDPEVVGFTFGENRYEPHSEYLDRYAFTGEKAPAEIWNRYVGQRIPEQCKHNQSKVVSFNF